MHIQIDSREKVRAIKKIVAYFDENKINHFVSKLPFGDYMSFDNPRVIVDRKQNLLEVCGNVCQQHSRFVREIEKANGIGVKLIFLVEHGSGIRTLEDVKNWVNPRLKVSKMAVSGERLYKIMNAMQSHYNIEWRFCVKSETGKEIIRILEEKHELQTERNLEKSN